MTPSPRRMSSCRPTCLCLIIFPLPRRFIAGLFLHTYCIKLGGVMVVLYPLWLFFEKILSIPYVCLHKCFSGVITIMPVIIIVFCILFYCFIPFCIHRIMYRFYVISFFSKKNYWIRFLTMGVTLQTSPFFKCLDFFSALCEYFLSNLPS